MCLVLAAANLAAAAQPPDNSNIAYPQRPVRFIVPFPPGGADTVARIVAQKLTETLQQQVVIDNRAGAASVIGTALAAKAANDGYTILFATSAFAIAAVVYDKLPYDPLRDFAPVGAIASAPLLLVAHPSVAATSVQELIALAKAKPNALNYASNGSGSITYLAAELFKSMAGVGITEVSYKGAGPSLTALLAGEVQIMVAPLGPSLPYVKAGRLNALGVPSAKRSPLFPDLPTIAESGLPGYEAANWYGAAAPAGTPASVIRVLNSHIERALRSAEVNERFANLGYEATPSTPAAFGSYVHSEIRKWAGAVKALRSPPKS